MVANAPQFNSAFPAAELIAAQKRRSMERAYELLERSPEEVAKRQSQRAENIERRVSEIMAAVPARIEAAVRAGFNYITVVSVQKGWVFGYNPCPAYVIDEERSNEDIAVGEAVLAAFKDHPELSVTRLDWKDEFATHGGFRVVAYVDTQKDSPLKALFKKGSEEAFERARQFYQLPESDRARRLAEEAEPMVAMALADIPEAFERAVKGGFNYVDAFTVRHRWYFGYSAGPAQLIDCYRADLETAAGKLAQEALENIPGVKVLKVNFREDSTGGGYRLIAFLDHFQKAAA